MKQTKAAFRNKPFISLKGSILFLILIPMSGLVHAQYSMGTTGQLMIPTAEMQETGTFMGGVNFLPHTKKNDQGVFIYAYSKRI